MAKYCAWFTEEPRYEKCMNFAEAGKSRCEDHRLKKHIRPGNLTTAQKNEVRKDFDHKCVICGGPAYEVNHIVPLAEFADHEKWKANLRSNLEVLCVEHHLIETADYRKSRIDLGDPNDYSTSPRNRKKKRMRKGGFHL